jgi:SpoVK/Ycf46/Vps4 family AAA+-type ATPase
MLPRLKQLVDEVAPLHSKLILLIGPPGGGKTALLSGLAEQARVSVMNLGLELGTRLSKLPNK